MVFSFLQPEEDATIWQIPLEILTVPNGTPVIDHETLLSTREQIIPMKDVKNHVYKLNAETCGVYRTLYPIDRLEKLGDECARADCAFSLSDR